MCVPVWRDRRERVGLSAVGLILNSTDAMALHYRHLVTQVGMRCVLFWWGERVEACGVVACLSV